MKIANRHLSLLALFVLALFGLSAGAESNQENADKDAPVFSPEVEAILNEAPDPEGYGAMERCISVRSIRGSQVLDDRHVVFELPSKTYYLVQFRHTCHQLRRNSTITYEPRGSQLCRLDDIRAINLSSGPMGPPCSIPGFYEVTAEQVALLRETLKAERQAEIDAYKAGKAKRKAEQQADR
jgi:hypothetical protein